MTILFCILLSAECLAHYRPSKMASLRHRTKAHVGQNLIFNRPSGREGSNIMYDYDVFSPAPIKEGLYATTLHPRHPGKTKVIFFRTEERNGHTAKIPVYVYRVKIKK